MVSLWRGSGTPVGSIINREACVPSCSARWASCSFGDQERTLEIGEQGPRCARHIQWCKGGGGEGESRTVARMGSSRVLSSRARLPNGQIGTTADAGVVQHVGSGG